MARRCRRRLRPVGRGRRVRPAPGGPRGRAAPREGRHQRRLRGMRETVGRQRGGGKGDPGPRRCLWLTSSPRQHRGGFFPGCSVPDRKRKGKRKGNAIADFSLIWKKLFPAPPPLRGTVSCRGGEGGSVENMVGEDVGTNICPGKRHRREDAYEGSDGRRDPHYPRTQTWGQGTRVHV